MQIVVRDNYALDSQTTQAVGDRGRLVLRRIPGQRQWLRRRDDSAQLGWFQTQQDCSVRQR